MHYQDPSDNDPFILTERSLAMSDGTVLRKTAKSKFGKMIPFQMFGYKLNIGPDYSFFIFAFFALTGIGALLVCAQIHFEASFYFILTSISINVIEVIAYILIFVSNPGIAIESVDPEATPSCRFCQQCQIYIQRTTVHCTHCKVCIIQYDHHCPWTSKCIGKNNLKRFYFFVAAIFVCLMYNVAVLPISLAPDLK